ncbi:flocculation protein FLO11-like isoform X2 [Pieris brassicae]|nr:flocculation protein FLO11-like isoform X2 [Pieris brassicae]XP_045515592.1 flocculation protein FLO11-like isoform X2 [Pieris brassicae]
MRRQGRLSAGGAHMVRTASALQVWLWLLLFVFQNEFRISRSIQPGYLDFDNLPETNFTCTGKVIGGYYADLETSCQMFHVCTVGQQDEPMDIKFLCLNGTVFDQETRVCERVDEVDCTKSEKFYSLNLELYGSTAPPIIPPEPNPIVTESNKQTKTSTETDPYSKDSSTYSDKTQNQTTETIDSTEDPLQEVNKDEHTHHNNYRPSQTTTVKEEEEYEEGIDEEYEDDYSHLLSTTTREPITTTSTTTKRPQSSTTLASTSHSPIPHIISSSPKLSSISPPSYSTVAPTFNPSSTLDPSLLSPQEFIYRHRGPGSEAISFQRQSFRPADGVYITHAPSQQFDHFQYESSRTVPRPTASRPVPFVQRPQPAPFRATTLDPRNQLLRPGPSPQVPDRHEISINQQPKPYPSSLPSQHPLPFNPFYYDRKRSEDSSPEEQSSLSARSVAPIAETKRPPLKPKSPPRVIVTASASVSDSNGKRLNYTVGNVVSAVKPIVAINYDDYKETDSIFDPFFLDVPKLQARRKTRSNKNRQIFTVSETATISSIEGSNKKTKATLSPVTHRATTSKYSTETPKPTTTVTWNPEDYVDDNYEPHAYIPPLAVLLSQDNKVRNKDKHSVKGVIGDRAPQSLKVIRIELSKPTQSAMQTISSQNAGSEVVPTNASPSPLEAPACEKSRSNDCRNRA